MISDLKFFKLLFILLTVSFCSILLFYSIDTIDGGFILSFVGRLYDNQIPYKDFDIVRPPGSIFLWKFLLPNFIFNSPYLIIVSRLIVILCIVYIGVLSNKILSNNRLNWLTISFLSITVAHSFNIMPWHTLDGILLGLTSIYLSKNKYYFSSIVLAILAGSTKQSFYLFTLISVLYNIYLMVETREKYIKRDYLFSSLFIIIASYFIYKYDILQNFPSFLQQTKNSNGLRQLFEKGIKSYLFHSTFYNIVFLLVLSIIIFKKRILNKELLFIITSVLFFINYALTLFHEGNYQYTNQFYVFLLFLHLVYNRKDYIGYLLFFLAWCSSISWGYNQPIFMIGILFYSVFKEQFNDRITLYFSIALLLLFGFIRIKSPYFNKSITETKYILCTDLPAISGLYIPIETYKYYKEVFSISNKIQDKIILPGTPLADVICKTYKNRASWEMNVEYPNFTLDKNLLKKGGMVFIVDKEPAVPINHSFFKSDFTKYIIENTSKTDSTQYFYIYKR